MNIKTTQQTKQLDNSCLLCHCSKRLQSKKKEYEKSNIDQNIKKAFKKSKGFQLNIFSKILREQNIYF